jgi:hypothetical protein
VQHFHSPEAITVGEMYQLAFKRGSEIKESQKYFEQRNASISKLDRLKFQESLQPIQIVNSKSIITIKNMGSGMKGIVNNLARNEKYL